MRTVTASSLRGKLKYFLDLVSDSYETLIIPRNDEDDAVVLMRLSEYNALMETNYLNSTYNNKEALQNAKKQADEGDVIEVDI
ncbi:type II toxin-antitoxin system Phd/YefM family antitoxin [Zunongwangia sp. F363]|uniref:Antitoxin n=1 Tax=Autumnicola tepida TaxID=3075595 RepID=A0ABU3CDF0_9FLAO|nr:type II toxin-antitoxin system Phd/YefM family antitoxin [Zunongwangia sp. F363]MDT0644363.1 type II toxin-antitoxin system Phd/YefM family antitoxin [Zunongwangia sp. F363]